jgi:hypothetical protein
MAFPVDQSSLTELQRFLADRYHDLQAAAIAASHLDVGLTVEACDTVPTEVRDVVADRFSAFVKETPPLVVASVAQGAAAGVALRFDEMRRDITEGRWTRAWAQWAAACQESCAFEDHPAWQSSWGRIVEEAAEVQEAEDVALYSGLLDDGLD